jgi:hypothetical protein
MLYVQLGKNHIKSNIININNLGNKNQNNTINLLSFVKYYTL